MQQRPGLSAAAGLFSKFFLAVSFCHNASLTTLCSLKTKQEEAESSTAAWGFTLGLSPAAEPQQGSCLARTWGYFLFLFSFFIHISHVLLFLHVVARAHGELHR